jgi:hypothetical protein
MIEIIDCVQGSEEWIKCRLGVPTASCFDKVLTKPRKTPHRGVRAKYMRQLAGEIITGLPTPGFTTVHTERGNLLEDEARRAYSFVHGLECQQVGFIKSDVAGGIGCSPDSLVHCDFDFTDGGVEIKTKLADLTFEYIDMHMLKLPMPDEHLPQVHGNMLVTDRAWWDLVVYWPGCPLYVQRIHRCETWDKRLIGELTLFNEELAAMVERDRRYGPATSFTDDIRASLALIVNNTDEEGEAA